MNMAVKVYEKGYCYIGGPITGVPGDNAEAFESAKDEVYCFFGKMPVSPLDVCLGVKGQPWVWYMAKCIPALMKCDSIYLLRGWWWSRGARWEFLIAKFLCRMPVAYQGGFWGGLRR